MLSEKITKKFKKPVVNRNFWLKYLNQNPPVILLTQKLLEVSI